MLKGEELVSRRGGALAAAALVLAAGCSSNGGGSDRDDAEPADVEVTGPVTGGIRNVPYNPLPEDLAEEYDYVEAEYFVAGEATAYEPAGALTADGEWTVSPAGSAPYQTRILVRRPVDADTFNGIVLVEWLNVTAGRDSDADFGFLYPELMGGGYAYVGISAQQAGVQAGGAILEVPGVPEEALVPLKEWDPERYAELDHPGDDHSYDIFTQVGEALRAPGELDPLDGHEPEYLVAAGESQSAGRMATYVNAVHPLAGVYDAFLIHSRGSGGAPLDSSSEGAAPGGLAIRTDLDDPVLQFETETDLTGLGFLAARQPDSDHVVTWEVAGTAHADQSTLDYGERSAEVWYTGPPVDFRPLCGVINDGPQGPVLRAAVAALSAWMVDDTQPPTAPPIEIANGEIVVDELGNARGGVRTPAVDAPTSILTGKGNESSVFCSLFGQMTPFSSEQLAALYPTHGDYLEAVTRSADAAVDAGFLLPEDRDIMVEQAVEAHVPS